MIDPVRRFRLRPSGAAILLLALCGTAQTAGAARYTQTPHYVPGELIVQYASPTTAAQAKAGYAARGLGLRRSLRDGRTHLLGLPSFMDVDGAVTLLADQPGVAAVEPNFVRRTRIAVPDDSLFGEQWGLYSTGQLNFVCDTDDSPCESRNDFASLPGADMNLPAAWDPGDDGVFERTGDRAVVVAVIDDAFDLTHPDLAANFIAGRDLVDNDNDPSPDAAGLLDHGTLVAGSLGAVGNNGEGIAGVAWRVSMMPLKVGRVSEDEVLLSSDAILDAYAYARNNGAQIVNASYGGPDCSTVELNAIRDLEQAGILFVTSAGNFNSNLDYSAAAYPANYREAGCRRSNNRNVAVDPASPKLSNLIAVAASNRQDNVASFSQFGPTSTDVAAPGLQIVTTAVGGGYVTGESCGNGGTCGVNGTSFSSPHVAGIAALIKSVYPDADYREVRARIIEGAEPGVSDGDVDELTAGGRVDAASSLDMAPRPSLVIRALRLVDDGNQRLDPGETLDIELTVENLWRPATGVQAQLFAPAGRVEVLGGPLALGNIATGATATARFSVRVTDALTSPYEDLGLALQLTADGAYAARRPFRLELAELTPGLAVSETLSEGLHDEFHTYHVDLPSTPGTAQRLVIRSTVTERDPATGQSKDIDVLVKYGRPAQYDIDLGAPAEDEPTFFTDADAVGGGEDGNEQVVIDNPQAGTYYITVLNYSLSESLGYTLEVSLDRSGGSGGGVMAPWALLWCAAAAMGAGIRRRHALRRGSAPPSG